MASVFSGNLGPATVKLLSVVILLFVSQQAFGSTISGFIYDEQRNPVSEVDVELLNENYAMRDKVRTNGIGRYQFNNLSDGRYYIRVLPFRYNLKDQTQEVVVDTLSILGNGVTFIQQDFYLVRKQGGLADTSTGVVFAQDVPSEAQILYTRAVEFLDAEKEYEGMMKLVEAVNAFPTYFAANQRLGMELLKTRQNLNAAKMFLRAAEINPRSSRSFYYAGFALSKIGKEYNRAALVALDKARTLATSSFEIAYLIGKIQRQEGNFAEAEKNLLAAKELATTRVPEIHIELAQLYANDLKQFGKAADELELYLKASNQKDDTIRKQIDDLRRKQKRAS